MAKLTAERLREVAVYDPITGEFRWRVKWCRKVHAGDLTGCLAKTGYLVIRIDGELHLAHRLAWLYMTGRWPAGQVDHRDLKRTNNAWSNLREATHGQNVQNSGVRKNNIHGVKGISLDRRSNRWVARVMVDRKMHWIGSDADPVVAKSMYDEAISRLHGEFARV